MRRQLPSVDERNRLLALHSRPRRTHTDARWVARHAISLDAWPRIRDTLPGARQGWKFDCHTHRAAVARSVHTWLLGACPTFAGDAAPQHLGADAHCFWRRQLQRFVQTHAEALVRLVRQLLECAGAALT